jgi:hypothetical protein
VHDLVDDAASERVNGQFLLGGKRPQSAAHAIDFGLADGFQMVLQRNDGGDDFERLQASVETLDFHVDDVVGKFGFLLAVGDMRGYSLLQIVDVVDEDAVEFVHLRINIAGDGDIDKEHGAVLAATEKQLTVLATKDCMGGAGRGDDDITSIASIVQPAELDGLAVELVGELNGAIVGAIGDEDGRSAVGHQVTCRQFTHLPRAHEIDVLAVERSEDLFGKLDGHRRHRHR